MSRDLINTDQSRLTWALILSVLLHGLLLTLLPLIRRAHLTVPQLPPTIDVDLAALPKVAARPVPPQAAPVPAPAAPAAPAVPVPKQQMVAPSDKGEEKEPENARYLSDRNNTVKEEMVHHGEPPPGNPESKQQAEAKQQADEAKREAAAQKIEKAESKRVTAEAARKPATGSQGSGAQTAALPKLDQLLPPADEMIRAGVVRPDEGGEAAPPAPEQHASVDHPNLLRHGDPWQGHGRGGTMDFLPNVRDGDVTMLNTKADQFAPFVRRVAVRVFQDFVILVRRSYDRGGQAAEESAVIEAVMDKKGQLLAINTKQRSGSSAFSTDRNLEAACREGFFDRNPPSGAEADDGKIHFVFDARLTLTFDASGRRVPAWVMMGAGLL